jgi:hypothetical protein
MEQALTLEQAMAKIAELEKANAAKARGNTIKRSEKGAVSVYGLGRFPVTLYMSQWQALFEKQDDIKAFILDNASVLAVKA